MSVLDNYVNVHEAAEAPDRCVPPKPFQHDADLLFSVELAAGDTLDIPNELPGFLGPDFSLPDPVNLLGHVPTPFFSRYFTSSRKQEQAPKCPLLYVFNVSHFP